jgi:hypothetical protein
VLPLLNVGFDPVRAFSAGLIDIIGDFVAERGVLPAAEVDAWKADLRSLRWARRRWSETAASTSSPVRRRRTRRRRSELPARCTRAILTL